MDPIAPAKPVKRERSTMLCPMPGPRPLWSIAATRVSKRPSTSSSSRNWPGKGQFMPLTIGGGAACWATRQLPKEFKFLKERFELYREVFPSLRRVVLINHEDCRYYEFLKSKLFGFLGRASLSHPNMLATTCVWSRSFQTSPASPGLHG